MNLDQLLLRADDEALQDLVGPPTMKLLMLLDARLTTPSRLRELILSTHKDIDLLLEKESRDILIDLLPAADAQILAERLGVSSGSGLYARLKDTVYKSKAQKRILLDFFDVSGTEPPPSEPPIAICKVSPHYPLFEHQRRAAKKVQNYISSSPYRVLLHMPTGSGKTRTTMNVIAEHLRQNDQAVVVWLAFSEELCEQAASEFDVAWSHLGNRSVDVIKFWGRREYDFQELQSGIVVAGLSKLYRTLTRNFRQINELGKRASLVVIDEAHSSVADTYKLILDALVVHHADTALLGLSATPGRTWDELALDEQLAQYFAKRKVTLEVPGYSNPVEYLIAAGYLASVKYEPLYHNGENLTNDDLRAMSGHFDIPERILEKLARDEARNLAIVGTIERLAKKHSRILVFAATVEHSQLLASVLHARGLTAFSVTSATSSSDRVSLIERFKSTSDKTMILCNYGVLTTGFDAPKTSAALIARPTKSLVLYTQMVGRVIRGPKAGGNETAEVVTVVDYRLPGFGSVAEAFNNWEDVWE